MSIVELMLANSHLEWPLETIEYIFDKSTDYRSSPEEQSFILQVKRVVWLCILMNKNEPPLEPITTVLSSHFLLDLMSHVKRASALCLAEYEHRMTALFILCIARPERIKIFKPFALLQKHFFGMEQKEGDDSQEKLNIPAESGEEKTAKFSVDPIKAHRDFTEKLPQYLRTLSIKVMLQAIIHPTDLKDNILMSKKRLLIAFLRECREHSDISYSNLLKTALLFVKPLQKTRLKLLPFKAILKVMLEDKRMSENDLVQAIDLVVRFNNKCNGPLTADMISKDPYLLKQVRFAYHRLLEMGNSLDYWSCLSGLLVEDDQKENPLKDKKSMDESTK